MEKDIQEALEEIKVNLIAKIDSTGNFTHIFKEIGDELEKSTESLKTQASALKKMNEIVKSKQEDELKIFEATVIKRLESSAKLISNDRDRADMLKKIADGKKQMNDAIVGQYRHIQSKIQADLETQFGINGDGGFVSGQIQKINILDRGIQDTDLPDARAGLNSVVNEIKGKNEGEFTTFMRELKDEGGAGKLTSGAAALMLGVFLQYPKLANALGINTSSVSGILTTALMAPMGKMLGILKNIPEILHGYLLQLKNILGMFVGLGQGLISIPLRIMEKAAEVGHKIKKDNVELFNQLERMQENFRASSGVGQGMGQMHNELRGRLLSYINPNNEAVRLYDAKEENLIEKQMQETASIIKAMGPRAELMAKTVTKNVTAADQSVANYYYKAKKLMNLSEDDIGKLTNMAISLGKSFPDVFDEISQATANVAKRFSLDFKMMSADVLTLRKDIVNFGHKSADELALVAGHIRQMGVSMSDAMAVFNKFNTFEDAATTAAQLSQTFGMVVDSMELLKAQSPDEILQQYKDAFMASGKSFETMDRFSKSLILQQTGLSDQAAQALFSAENAGKTYEEIMKDVEANDPTERQARNMEEMKDAIVELKTTLSEDFKSFFDAMQEGFTKRLFANPNIRAAMERMAKAMDGIFLKFTAMDMRKFEPFINKMLKGVNELSNFISSPKFINYLTGIANSIGKILDGFTDFTGKGSKKIQQGINDLIEYTKPIFTFLADFGLKVIMGIGSSIINALPGIVGSINNLLDDVINAFEGQNNPLESIFTRLFGTSNIEGQKSAFKKVIESLQELAVKVFGSGDGNDRGGLIGRIRIIFDKLMADDDENSIPNRFFKAMKEKFTQLSQDPTIINSLASLSSTIARGMIDALNKQGGFLSLLINDEPLQPVQDLIISDKGAYKLNSQDEIMAMKPGGAIEDYMKNVAALNQINSGSSAVGFSSENLAQLKTVFVEALATVGNSSNQDKELVINLDSQKVGSVLIKGGLVTMMTNPNIAGTQPTLNTSSINTSNGQTFSNAYRGV